MIAASGLVLVLQPWSMGGSAFSNLLAVAGTLHALGEAPADIAGVFLFLASRESRSLTGQCLVASHGEVMA